MTLESHGGVSLALEMVGLAVWVHFSWSLSVYVLLGWLVHPSKVLGESLPSDRTG